MFQKVVYDNYFSIRAFPGYQNCEIVDIPQKYDAKAKAWAFQKDSPYLDLFNYQIRVNYLNSTAADFLNICFYY